jgi:hypothetical protein
MIGSGRLMLKQSGGLLFVNPKKQNNLFVLGRARVRATVPGEPKFLAPLFAKKRLLSCFQLNLSGSNFSLRKAAS